MYYVTKATTVDVGPGRHVVLQAGPRGQKVVKMRSGEITIDLDAKLREVLPKDVLDKLIKTGVIEVRDVAPA